MMKYPKEESNNIKHLKVSKEDNQYFRTFSVGLNRFIKYSDELDVAYCYERITKDGHIYDNSVVFLDDWGMILDHLEERFYTTNKKWGITKKSDLEYIPLDNLKNRWRLMWDVYVEWDGETLVYWEDDNDGDWGVEVSLDEGCICELLHLIERYYIHAMTKDVLEIYGEDDVPRSYYEG